MTGSARKVPETVGVDEWRMDTSSGFSDPDTVDDVVAVRFYEEAVSALPECLDEDVRELGLTSGVQMDLRLLD